MWASWATGNLVVQEGGRLLCCTDETIRFKLGTMPIILSNQARLTISETLFFR